ncbi:relaxase/mobilization nuclease domain-containing protein [uncultured Mucilaginibacter sp.]|uniref:relaxase/mobilization nuclease domain-containing protein n=1 Tax=uncultured Mucilaginibacter sp. TaxID=797541 RepID=UPI00260E26C1|nr:relaxase/mobilization nuclease domain-containing protein [uncultured Mucilaginibacter sp.]
MIGKVMSGKSFGGCVRYVVNKPEAKILDAQGVRIDSADRINHDFNLQRKMNPGLGKAVGHIALSWSISDKDILNESVMTQVAKEYLEKMKILDTQYLIVQHQDRQHPHVHIIYNRVNNQGKTISDQFERQLNAKVCKEITLKHGYHLAEGKQHVNRHRLTGADQKKYQLFDAISKAVKQSSSWKALEEKLKWQGISVQYKCKSGTTEVQGVSFGKGKYSFKGSELDRSLSYGRIRQELAQNRSVLGIEQPSFHHPEPSSYRNNNDFSSEPFLEVSQTAYPGTDNSKTVSEETEHAVFSVAETAGKVAFSLLRGLSVSAGDHDNEQQKKKKKQKSYR